MNLVEDRRGCTLEDSLTYISTATLQGSSAIERTLHWWEMVWAKRRLSGSIERRMHKMGRRYDPLDWIGGGARSGSGAPKWGVRNLSGDLIDCVSDVWRIVQAGSRGTDAAV